MKLNTLHERMKTAALSRLIFLLILSYSLAFTQNDVYEDLWNNNVVVANETLHVDFLKQMQKGSLQAERFVNFTLQDINYLLKVSQMLKNMSEKVKQPDDIKAFMLGRYKSYKSFADSLLNQFFLKEAPPVKLTTAMKKYLSDYSKVMNEEDPIYFAVALLPCARLWVWLANYLDIPKTSAYYTWAESNKHGHPEKHYKALLNKYLDTPEKVKKASTIFRMQMVNEHEFFCSS